MVAERRRVTLRLLDALRSDEFRVAKEYLLARQQVLDEVADGGITDPSEIAARMQAVRATESSDASLDPGLAEVAESAAGADERLMDAGTGIRTTAPPAAEPTDPDEVDEVDEEPAAA